MSDIKVTGGAADTIPLRTYAQQLEKMPPCQAGCPNSGDIRAWLGIIAQHDKNGISLEKAYDMAWSKLVERNPLPATVGRICPHPCEDLCTRQGKDGAVSINAMERFLGDWGISRSLGLPKTASERRTEAIGVIGSGPASLSFAYQMARRGYLVTMYEKHDRPGGMLRFAIPDYRLPRDILDAEIEKILGLGVTLECNVDIGHDISLETLRDRHKLVFLGLGAQAARELGIPGERGPGVIAGIDYLQRRKQHVESLAGRHVVVVGGGNTAIDAARSARRDGAEVTVLYRRSEADMPAAEAEIADARTEGVGFTFLGAPSRLLRDGVELRGVEIQQMQLGEPDASGRRRPEPVAGSLSQMPADLVIVAVSQAPDWSNIDLLDEKERWLQTTDEGWLDENFWAGGDDRGPGIASMAIAQGRIAAESVDARLRGTISADAMRRRKALDRDNVKTDFYGAAVRAEIPRRSEDAWLQEPEAEITHTITAEQAHAEAARCMSCGLCFDCQQCFMYCNAAGFTRIEETGPGNYFVLALEACEGCGKCIEICPCGYLEQRDAEPVS